MHGHREQAPRSARALRWSLIATLGFVLVEFGAGYYAGSLALISDAVHNLTDVPTLALSLLALHISQWPADRKRTYGYHRAGVLAAFVNALLLVAVAGYILWEGYARLQAPVPVRTSVMLVVAVVALGVNSGIALALWRARRDLNIRSVLVHNAGDAASNLGIVIGASVIAYTGWYAVDPVISFGIAALVLWSAWGIIQDTTNILLEGLPKGMRLEEVAREILKVPGVEEVHDVHIWSLGSALHALSCHIRVADMPVWEAGNLLARINQVLAERFRITHTTIQFEHAGTQPVQYMPGSGNTQN